MPEGLSNVVAIAATIHTLALVGSGAPAITVQPFSRLVQEGSSVNLTAMAAGLGSLSYQWQFNGADILGATNSTLHLPNVQAACAGAYALVVTNALGPATSQAAILTTIPTVPDIVQQPEEETVATAGGTVALSVVVGPGTEPFNYQWLLNGTNMAGATSPWLVLPNVQAAQAGVYAVVVTNATGSVTSQAALLTVTPAAPVIDLNPWSLAT